MRFKQRCRNLASSAILVSCLVLALGFAESARAAGGSYVAWQSYRDALQNDPSLLRYYAFEEPPSEATPARDLGKSGANLTYRLVKKSGAPAEKFTAVQGRWPGKKAIRLDQGVLTAPPFDLPGKAFSIMAWLRINGMGSHRGNNESTNGTLLSQGSGYWDGFRLTYQYPHGTVGFEIGRPKPSHSKGVRSQAVADRTWHHFAATWDGREMRLYIDGLLAAADEFTDAWTMPPKHGAFCIGYADAGVGSVVLDVDEVAILRRALAADEVLRHACLCPVLPEAVRAMLRKASEHLKAKNHRGAADELAAAIQSPGLSGLLQAALRLQLAECLLAQQENQTAGEQLLKVLEIVDAGPQYQGQAMSRLRGLVEESPGNAVPRGAHERLLAIADLKPSERLALMLSLGHSRFAAGEYAAAREAYAKIAAQADVPAAYRSIARLRIAQSYLRERDYAKAKEQYGRQAAIKDAPAHHRWEADQQIRAILRIEKGLPARDPAASRTVLPTRPPPAVSFWVAVDGSDSNPGTRQRPFASLQRARDAIREVKKARGGLPAGGATVYVSSGKYSVLKTLTLSAEDSGTETAPVVYSAAPGETPVFSGGVQVRGFEPVRDPAVLARLPEEARGRVVQADLAKCGITAVTPLVLGGYASGRPGPHPVMELYFNRQPLQMARWPNQGWCKVEDVVSPELMKPHRIPGSKTGQLKYAGDRPTRWVGEQDAMLHGYWFWDWADCYQRIASIDVQKREITLAKPWHGYGFRKERRYYALNLLAELDVPGEYYLDRRAAIAYCDPPSDPAKALVEVPVMESPFVHMEKVAHVTLERLTFEMGCGNGLVIRNAEQCLLAGCTVRCFGGDGVTIDGGHRSGLLSCDIDHMGRGGTVIAGGDRKTLAPAGHFVENCHIHHLSRIDHTYTPAVRLSGVGSRIAHNLMHDIASSAINQTGNDHTVEFNETYNVVMESDDQGGVDSFGDPTFAGNVYRYNYWHHIGDWNDKSDWPLGGQAGIRLDDAISGVLVYGNVFYRCSAGHWGFGGVQIHGGTGNLVDNNLFVDCKIAISFSPWPVDRWQEHVKKHLEAGRIDPKLYLARYPHLARLLENPNANKIWRNVAYRCGQFRARDRGTNELVDNFVTAANPGCAGVETGVLRLPQPGLDANACALAPIPFDEMGLYRDQYRQQLPARPTPSPAR